MRAFIFGLFLSVAALAHVGNDDASHVNCQTFFGRIKAALPTVGFGDSYLWSKVTVKRSVFLERIIHDATNGETFNVFERREGAWGSYADTNSYDPQGDPRWILEVIGTDVAHVLGFYWDGDARMQLPERETWYRRVSMVSKQLVAMGNEPIAIGFHSNLHVDPESKKANLDIYFDRFIENGEIPVAKSGIPFLHDMSFHTGAVVLSQRDLTYARARLQYFKSAASYLLQRSKQETDTTRASALAKLRKYFRLRMVEMTDAGTGLISPMIAAAHIGEEIDGETANEVSSVQSSHYHLLGKYGQSPENALRSLWLAGLAKMEIDPRLLSVTEVNRLVSEHETIFKSSFAGFDIHRPLDISVEDFCVAINSRREELRAAAKQLALTLPRAPLELETINANKKPPWWRQLFKRQRN